MNRELQHTRKKNKPTHNAPKLVVLKPAGWDFQALEGEKKKEKRKEGGCKFNRGGLFFSINNSFCRTGEGVKLDIPEERRLQQRMTRNNEEILPQTLSPAEWRHKSTKKKLKSGRIPDSSGEITLLLLSSTNIYCKATFKKTPVKCSFET